MRLLLPLFLALSFGWLFMGCKGNPPEEPLAKPRLLNLAAPANLAAEIPSPERNPLTVEGVELGRMLFYDPILSGNNRLSCSSCHQQEKAFSDGVAFTAVGVTGRPLKRHVPALMNLAWMNGLFWDGGAKDMESLAFGPLTHPDEMGQDLKELAQELQQHPRYPGLFRRAFGSDSITSARIAKALAQFQRTLISANSPYDKYKRGENDGALTGLALEGMALFQRHCSSCHATDFFTDHDFHNNGLDSIFSEDFERLAFGRGRITRLREDIGKYKTPTLRNISLTAPYMHDGRFATLEEVLEHYRTGVVYSETLAQELMQTNGKPGLPITAAEQEKIILFLHTLTDKTFTQNNSLSSPLGSISAEK